MITIYNKCEHCKKEYEDKIMYDMVFSFTKKANITDTTTIHCPHCNYIQIVTVEVYNGVKIKPCKDKVNTDFLG